MRLMNNPNTFGYVVSNMRRSASGPVAWFSIEFGIKGPAGDGTGFTSLVEVRDCAMLRNSSDNELWIRLPEKKRLKDGQAVKKANGFDTYDPIAKFTGEQTTEGWRLTKSAFQLRKAITADAVALFATLADTPTPVAPKAQPTAELAAAGKIESQPGSGIPGYDDTDSLPF